MDFKELKQIVRKGEGLNLEFKLKANHPEKIVREAVAFANTEGGLLLIGVDDDKTLRGLKFADEDEYVMLKAFAEYCHPPIKYELRRIPLENDREILSFYIPKSEQIHYVMEDAHTRKTYIRVSDKSVQASYEMREILKGKRNNKNVKFHYGEKERILMQYLKAHSAITVDEFSTTANIPRKIASRTLILLVLAQVLQIKPNEVKDSFEFIEFENE